MSLDSSCLSHISLNSPPSSMSSLNVPRSPMALSLSTRIWSAFWIVDSLCAMTSVVLPLAASFNCATISFSVLVSSADVASSKMRIGGSFRMARAIATLCFSPPLRRRPRSPTIVS
mmetsp:Transcript_12944/g.51657  ORF Transcript_12944/g.51657 Transcript_12944/m.51657 type:complete len:116 (-) Transcript_12944:1008-1355(-)